MEELLAFIVECIGEHDLSMWWVLVRMRGTRQQLGSSVRVVTTTVVWPLPATSHMDHPSLLVICRGEPASVRPRAASSRHSCWCGHWPAAGLGWACAMCSVIISIKCCHQLPPAHCQPGCLAVYQQLQSTFLSCYCHEGGH